MNVITAKEMIIAHPINDEQINIVKAFFNALKLFMLSEILL